MLWYTLLLFSLQNENVMSTEMKSIGHLEYGLQLVPCHGSVEAQTPSGAGGCNTSYCRMVPERLTRMSFPLPLVNVVPFRTYQSHGLCQLCKNPSATGLPPFHPPLSHQH